MTYSPFLGHFGHLRVAKDQTVSHDTSVVKINLLNFSDNFFERVQQVKVVVLDVELHVVPVVDCDATLERTIEQAEVAHL